MLSYKLLFIVVINFVPPQGGLYGRVRMIVGFTITCVISAYHH
jgi:hypothetical protein